ncbi:class II aldolase/adducin family protein [Phyllobacterium leguminum]|uniref:Ribulose-5-phosphate 4-epimerase/fuculose-1-phosphate aldolase n=1 Tax=Phyllobacterium leguminum TaxID=314237 RepID=A0A318T1C5_9HYPH|nr:class II aldolase/adducin family protein [Phyllobacterium leguminum]PYE86581.1 ribulose-5-phosphate 4-epimerase/fuculose-1-phosphate aldolase [Phyllobacterium leguminum]
MARFMIERQEIADTCRTLADNGYLAGTGGNIGVRVDDRLMAVTPSATDYSSMRAEDVVILDIETLVVVEGDKAPTIEKGLHARMLGFHRNRKASVHTHQPIASAVALLHEKLNWQLDPSAGCPSPLPSPRKNGERGTSALSPISLPGDDEHGKAATSMPPSPRARGEGKGEGQSGIAALGSHVARVPYRPSGTGMLVKALANALRPDVFAYLLASHGIICAGTDLKTATGMIREIEASAAAYLRGRILKNINLDSQLQAFIMDALEKA